MSMCPGRVWLEWQRDFSEDLRLIMQNKIEVICSVITNTELKEMNQPDLMAKFNTAGLESIQYSIHDKWLTNSIDTYFSFVNSILHHIHKEKTILIHCNGGKGRTGLIIVSCLFFLGVPIDQGISLVRSVRPAMLRNPAQEVFLHALYSRIQDPEKSLFRKESFSMSSKVYPILPESHTHLSDSSESNEVNYDARQDEDQGISSTEHS